MSAGPAGGPAARRTTGPAPPEPPEEMDWVDLRSLLRETWDQGEHVSILGMTGDGKSVIARELVRIRRARGGHVLVCDVKGDDPSVRQPGEQVIRSWPPDVDAGPLLRLAPPMRRRSQYPAASRVFAAALDDVGEHGRRAVVLDELRAMTDPKILGLGPLIEHICLEGRNRGATLIGASQAPRWVPHASYDQASLIFLLSLLDTEARRRLSEIGGDTRRIMAALGGLRKHDFLLIREKRQLIRSRVDLRAA